MTTTEKELTVVTIRDLKIDANSVVACEVTKCIGETDKAEIRIKLSEPQAFCIPMSGKVQIAFGENLTFTGKIVSARIFEGQLIVSCDGFPELSAYTTSGACHMHNAQLVRLMMLDIGGTIDDGDEDSEISFAISNIDWDNAARDLMICKSVQEMQESFSKSTLQNGNSKYERMIIDAFRSTLETVNRQNDSIEKSDRFDLFKEDFISKIRADSWRFRKIPDSYEIIAKVSDVCLATEVKAFGGIEFFKDCTDLDIFVYMNSLSELLKSWENGVLAKVTVFARDAWTAKKLGLNHIYRALEWISFLSNYSSAFCRRLEPEIVAFDYELYLGNPPTQDGYVLVRNITTREYWLGDNRCAPEGVELCSLVQRSCDVLPDVNSIEDGTDLLNHVKRAISWRYKACLTQSGADRYLLSWISLEMMFQRPNENTTALVRRLPQVMVCPATKRRSIRRELQKTWVRLRDEIVHRAILEHDDLAEGIKTIEYYSDCTLSYAIDLCRKGFTYEMWLDHLDRLNDEM